MQRAEEEKREGKEKKTEGEKEIKSYHVTLFLFLLLVKNTNFPRKLRVVLGWVQTFYQCGAGKSSLCEL